MTTVFVANRGEIARRILRTARRMGFRTVAAHSAADRDAPFVREADEAVEIGPAPASESYLAIDRVVAAARKSKADLVHPGYGFLAESAQFARAVEAAGMHFVGPPPEVLESLGDKAAAKALAEQAGVPVLPGYRDWDQRDDAFAQTARDVGFPVMIKPAAGGGGIGMQLVSEERTLPDALARARRVAKASFGDERLILERAVERPRHVEVQILADTHGSLFALGERDCSAQRRHQKILEETPAPGLDDERRRELADAAVNLTRATGYVNAGTVEFILDEAGDFFFLEVNARLQVEHPVTERVWDVDLVEQQLRIALGERVGPFGPPSGWAIEARVYAEDPASGFLPSTGTLAHVRWPESARVDAGYEEGSAVTRHYDPLLAKIVARGPDRDTALASLDRALADTELLGIRSNLPFLRRLVAHPAVTEGRITTDLVEGELASLARPDGEPPREAWQLAAAVELRHQRRDRRDPWSALGAWRAGERALASVVLRHGDDERLVRIDPARLATTDEPHRFAMGGRHAAAARVGSEWHIAWDGATYEFATTPRERGIDVQAASDVTAPMPGQVIAVHARAGQQVVRGDLLAVVEAMKMELRVEAPGPGTVRAVLCAVGDQVERGQRLVDLEPAV